MDDDAAHAPGQALSSFSSCASGSAKDPDIFRIPSSSLMINRRNWAYAGARRADVQCLLIAFGCRGA